MKLAKIYNLWDGEELLIPSMNNARSSVDLFIIVWQDISNWGEEYNPLKNLDLRDFDNVVLAKYNPRLHVNPGVSEREKRNLGIQLALDHNCTHFLHSDCDEFFEDFRGAKREYINSGCDGSVARILTYFKHPTLRLAEPDNYYVPFIHKLKRNTVAGGGSYPYYCDPTRRINTHDVWLIQEPMHHFSWVRKDIHRKARNSTARNNIFNSNLVRDYLDPYTKAGTKLIDYQNQELIEVDDVFGLSGIFK